jgi:hypothetical protein
MICQIYDQMYYSDSARIYTNGGNDLVKASFNDALTTLDFSKFKDVVDFFEP